MKAGRRRKRDSSTTWPRNGSVNSQLQFSRDCHVDDIPVIRKHHPAPKHPRPSWHAGPLPFGRRSAWAAASAHWQDYCHTGGQKGTRTSSLGRTRHSSPHAAGPRACQTPWLHHVRWHPVLCSGVTSLDAGCMKICAGARRQPSTSRSQSQGLSDVAQLLPAKPPPISAEQHGCCQQMQPDPFRRTRGSLKLPRSRFLISSGDVLPLPLLAVLPPRLVALSHEGAQCFCHLSFSFAAPQLFLLPPRFTLVSKRVIICTMGRRAPKNASKVAHLVNLFESAKDTTPSLSSSHLHNAPVWSRLGFTVDGPVCQCADTSEALCSVRRGLRV